MKKLLLSTLLALNATHIHTASNDTDQNKIDATQILATAWNHFSTSWKKSESALASKRAETFASTTGLKASVIYANADEFDINRHVPGASCRLGLTGLKLGKADIECFVSHADDPIEELTKKTTYMGWGECEANTRCPLYPTIWHFLASENGKQIVQEYLELKN